MLTSLTIEIVGWIGTIAFAISALPQMCKSIRDKHSDGISAGTIALWLVGEGATLAYVARLYWNIPLMVNYLSNLMMVGVIAWYKWRPRDIA